MTGSKSELDVRELPPSKAAGCILRRLGELSGEEHLVVRGSGSGVSLAQQLEQVRPGQYNTGPLQAGPNEFRLEVRPRQVRGERSVSELIGWDQRRLDDILDDVNELAETGDFTGALRHFEDFRAGLEHHIAMEEQVLFPLYQKLSLDTEAAMAAMYSEHVLIRTLVEQVAEALRTGDLPSFARVIENLYAVMDVHDQKEEDVVFPRLDAELARSHTLDTVFKALLAI